MSGSEVRPERLVVVLGTATGVGKTWVTCAVAAAARQRGIRVAARKPVQSFEADASAAPLEATDADLLGRATGEDARTVCPPHRWYPLAMAPPMASDALGRSRICFAEIRREIRWAPGTELALVETVGGVRSPLAHDIDGAAFAQALEPDLTILVAESGLGTINAVRLSMEALRPLDVVVLLNRYDPAQDLHARNRSWLAEQDGYRLVTDHRCLVVTDVKW
ncbi:MAG: ATP-dependent dethiobiotin synthetase BioD [Acidimicrobiales bacterium]